MATFRVELGAASHAVHCAPQLIAQLGDLARGAGLKAGRAVIVTDANVAKLYGEAARDALAAARFAPIVIEVPAGESSKSLTTLERLYDRLTAAEIDRSTPLFALGGGVIGDLAGFAAA